MNWGALAQLIPTAASLIKGGGQSQTPLPAKSNAGIDWGSVAAAAPSMAAALGGSKTPTQGGSTSSFWSTPAAGALISGGLGMLGGGISAVGQGKQNEAQMAQQQQQFAAELAQRQKEFEAEQAMSKQKMALESTQLDPLAQQKSRQQAAILAALIGGVQNIQAPAGLEGFVPGGGMSIPEGGWSDEVKQMLSGNARQAAEGDFYKNAQGVGGTAPDLSQFYGAPQATVKPQAASWYDSSMAQKQAATKAMSGALDPNQSTIPKTRNRNWLSRATKQASELF